MSALYALPDSVFSVQRSPIVYRSFSVLMAPARLMP
jgi:hypothetical protein